MKLRLGLQLRFLLAVVLSAALFALAASALAYALGKRRAEEAAQRAVASLQSAVEKTAAIAVYAHDASLMQEVTEGVARDALVRRVRILSPDGHVLAQSTPHGGEASELRSDRALASPFDRNETLGVLRVEIDAAQVGVVARREAWTLAALVAAQSVLVAFVIFLAGARLVSRPIARLARLLPSMPAGTTEQLTVPPTHAHDEIGTLVRAANELLSANAQALARERSLREDIEKMEAQYRQIFDSTSAGIFVLDRRGRLINGNPTVLRMIGGDKDDMRRLRGEDFLARVFARPDRLRAMMAESARTGKTMSADVELFAAGGQAHWAHCLISVQEDADASGEGGMVEGVLYDITERKQVERDVRQRAERDALTGALNRAATEDEIDRFIDAASAASTMTLLFLDLDGFKLVNDRHGHRAGDQVLQEATTRLSAELRRGTDFIGRVGGDEFVAVLPQIECSDAAAVRVASAFVEALSAPFELDDGASVRIGVSIGIASFPRHGRQRRELTQVADEAMYAVKRHGKQAFATGLVAVDAVPAQKAAAAVESDEGRLVDA